AVGDQGFPPTTSAAVVPYYGHLPVQPPAGPPQSHGVMVDRGSVGPSYQSYSGFSLPDAGRAPLFSMPPGLRGSGGSELTHPGGGFYQHHQQQSFYQMQQQGQQGQHNHHEDQQYNLPGIMEAPDPNLHELELEGPTGTTPAPPGTALAIMGSHSSSQVATNYAAASSPAAATSVSQASAEGVDVAEGGRGVGGGSGIVGGRRGGMLQPARGTVAGVVAAVAAAAGTGGDGEATQNNAYNDIGLVVTRTKELEKIMRDLFGATGNGLNELLSSLRTERRIDPRTQQRIRSIAAMRNKLVHSVDANNLTISNTFGASARKAFKAMCDDLEVSLRDCASKAVEEPFEQASRPADAFRLGNHPAFRGIGGAGPRQEDSYDEAAGLAEAEEAAAAARRDQEALVVRDSARFPHNLITAKRKKRGD
ncbi:unnamed protein product, partial [Scytosiphon promiscuus]